MRMYPGALRQRLVARRGMLSDDTEHACMTAQALLAEGDDPAAFACVLGWKLRWWLLGLPPAIGFGTLRALLRLWIGFARHGAACAQREWGRDAGADHRRMVRRPGPHRTVCRSIDCDHAP